MPVYRHIKAIYETSIFEIRVKRTIPSEHFFQITPRHVNTTHAAKTGISILDISTNTSGIYNTCNLSKAFGTHIQRWGHSPSGLQRLQHNRRKGSCILTLRTLFIVPTFITIISAPAKVCRRMIPGTCAAATSCQPPWSSGKVLLRPAVPPQEYATACN